LEFKKPSQTSSLNQAATLETILEQMEIPLKALEKEINSTNIKDVCQGFCQ
jgi:hypothetical protein